MAKTDVALNSSDIDITLSGSLVSKIASLFIPLLKSTVIPQVITQVKEEIKDIVQNTIDPLLAQDATQQTIPYLAGVTFDFAEVVPLKVENGYLEGAVNGTFFNIEKPVPSAYSPVAFPLRDAAGKDFQGFLTDYVLNTLFESGFSTGNTVDFTYLLKTYLNIEVTTDLVGQVVPAVLEKYGAGVPVSLYGKFVQKPSTAQFTTEGALLNSDIQVICKVGPDSAFDAELLGIDVASLLYAVEGVVFGHVSLDVGSIGAFSTTLDIDAQTFLANLVGYAENYIKVANQQLSSGLAIPTVFGFDVSDIEIINNNGYVEGGFSPSPQFYQFLAWGNAFLKAEKEKINAAMQPLEFIF